MNRYHPFKPFRLTLCSNKQYRLRVHRLINCLRKKMKVVLVMLNNLQSYIFDNIQHLIAHGNNSIVLVVDRKFNTQFENVPVEIVNIEDLIPEYKNMVANIQDTFRNGFWQLATYRFLALYEYMKQYNVQSVLHLENDVLIYKNIDTINFHNRQKLLLTMDSENRCIPGIMYIPTHEVLKRCIDIFNPGLNDMQNFAVCYYKLSDYVDTLPIFIHDHTNDITTMVSNHFKHYNAIFDAAAIGQYLGGVDPRNKSGDTRGFVNETCIIDYSNYKFIWKIENGKKIPIIVVNGNEYPVINLHIHCKDLKQFV